VLWHNVKRRFLSLGLPLLHRVSGSSWYAAIPLPNKLYSFDLQTQKPNGQWHWVINNRLNLYTGTSELSTEWRNGFVKLLKFIEEFANIRFVCHHTYRAVVLLDISSNQSRKTYSRDVSVITQVPKTICHIGILEKAKSWFGTVALFFSDISFITALSDNQQ
jgi:hypothetical protein